MSLHMNLEGGARSLGPVLALGLLILGVGCALTVEQERQLGDRFAAQVQRKMRVVTDPMVVSYVRDMGRRLAVAAGPQPYSLTFNVVEDRKVNAFAGPAGYVYVHTGLILKARNSSELAAVMAHEISHVTLRHISRAVARQQQAAGIGVLIQVVTDSPTLGSLAGTGAGIVNLRYDRQAEAEADRSGVILMRRAGYDPRGMVTMFQLLQGEGSGGGFLSSHPGAAQRVVTIRRQIGTLPPAAGLITDDGRLPQIQSRIRAWGSGGIASFLLPAYQVRSFNGRSVVPRSGRASLGGSARNRVLPIDLLGRNGR